jgi:hypothetical protein
MPHCPQVFKSTPLREFLRGNLSQFFPNQI